VICLAKKSLDLRNIFSRTISSRRISSEPVDYRNLQTYVLGILLSFILFYLFQTGLSEIINAYIEIPLASKEIEFWSAITYLTIIFTLELWVSFTIASMIIFNNDFMMLINFSAFIQTLFFMFVYCYILVQLTMPYFVPGYQLFLASPFIVLVKVFKSPDLFYFILVIVYTQFSITNLQVARVIEIG